MGDECDYDRSLATMICDKDGCNYSCPHYHCKICGEQVNSDEKRQEFHPCCSEEHIKMYNAQFPYVVKN